MKKSRKLLCVLLALVMVVSLLPVMAFARRRQKKRSRDLVKEPAFLKGI